MKQKKPFDANDHGHPREDIKVMLTIDQKKRDGKRQAN